MLSIAFIAAALQIAALILQLCGRNSSECATLVTNPQSPAGMMMSMTNSPPAPSAHPIRPVVAMVLRVQNPDCACENARKFADKTFVVGTAPQLPFSGCTRADCSCRYQPITNRRTKGERRKGTSRREEIRFEMKDDRRSGKDRRQNNNVWKTPV
jgi:hypothetical protein